MERQSNSLSYAKETIRMKADFIQLLGGNPEKDTIKLLVNNSVRINYCCANDAAKVKQLFEAGVEFPLVDRVAEMLKVADQQKIPRLKPKY